MPNPIPQHRREQVRIREINRCIRCGMAGSEWHHRRGRRVGGPHQHCSCNGVLLCKTCHDWAHGHPFEARALGLVVSRHQPEPGVVPVTTHFGVIALDCQGMFTFKEDE